MGQEISSSRTPRLPLGWSAFEGCQKKDDAGKIIETFKLTPSMFPDGSFVKLFDALPDQRSDKIDVTANDKTAIREYMRLNAPRRGHALLLEELYDQAYDYHEDLLRREKEEGEGPSGFTLHKKMNAEFAENSVVIRCGHMMEDDVVFMEVKLCRDGPPLIKTTLIEYDLPTDHPRRGVPLHVEREPTADPAPASTPAGFVLQDPTPMEQEPTATDAAAPAPEVPTDEDALPFGRRLNRCDDDADLPRGNRGQGLRSAQPTDEVDDYICVAAPSEADTVIEPEQEAGDNTFSSSAVASGESGQSHYGPAPRVRRQGLVVLEEDESFFVVPPLASPSLSSTAKPGGGTSGPLVDGGDEGPKKRYGGERDEGQD